MMSAVITQTRQLVSASWYEAFASRNKTIAKIDPFEVNVRDNFMDKKFNKPERGIRCVLGDLIATTMVLDTNREFRRFSGIFPKW